MEVMNSASTTSRSSSTSIDEARLCPKADGFYKALTQLLVFRQHQEGPPTIDWKETNAGLASLNLKVGVELMVVVVVVVVVGQGLTYVVHH